MLLDSGFKILERNSAQHILCKGGKKKTHNKHFHLKYPFNLTCLAELIFRITISIWRMTVCSGILV